MIRKLMAAVGKQMPEDGSRYATVPNVCGAELQ